MAKSFQMWSGTILGFLENHFWHTWFFQNGYLKFLGQEEQTILLCAGGHMAWHLQELHQNLMDEFDLCGSCTSTNSFNFMLIDGIARAPLDKSASFSLPDWTISCELWSDPFSFACPPATIAHTHLMSHCFHFDNDQLWMLTICVAVSAFQTHNTMNLIIWVSIFLQCPSPNRTRAWCAKFAHVSRHKGATFNGRPNLCRHRHPFAFDVTSGTGSHWIDNNVAPLLTIYCEVFEREDMKRPNGVTSPHYKVGNIILWII